MLTREQYIKNYENYFNYLDEVEKLRISGISIEEIKKLIIKKLKELKLKYTIDKSGIIVITHPNKLPEYQELIVTKDVIVPRVERQSSCDIAILSKNFKDQMLGSIDYTNNTNREVHYTLCETPKGKRMSSASFGSDKAVSPRQGKCQSEFGASSKEIAEFHTHPGKYSGIGEFSGGDLLSYYNKPPEKINCVVSETKTGNTKNIRVRCAKSKDVQNFLMSSEWKKSQEITDENSLEFERAINNLSEGKQNKFSCFVDFPLGSKFKELSQIKKEQKKKAPKFYKKTFGEEKTKEEKIKPRKTSGFDFGGGFQL